MPNRIGHGAGVSHVSALARVLFVMLALVLALVWVRSAQAAPAPLAVLTVKGPITPVVANFIERGIDDATRRGDQALILQLDTPGGSVTVMEEIIQTITAARLPIIVYVTPPGAMAASAGTFIVLSGQLAAMAPGSTIGAASPVGAQGEDVSRTADAKAKNVLAAQIRALAQRRGPEAVAWAERTVRDAVAANAEEAHALGVVDIIAQDLDDLVAQLDGREVVVQGQSRTLQTQGAPTRQVGMNIGERMMQTMIDPAIAFILLILGINAILIELQNPGIGFAGAFGAICLVVALLGLGALNVNFAGLALIGLAFVFFVLDIKFQSHGVLTAGGLLAFVLGGGLLFNTAYVGVPWLAIIGAALMSAIVFTFLVGAGWRARRRPVAMGRETLVGQLAEARTPLTPNGQVFAMGSLWRAISLAGSVEPGQRVRIERIEGLTLYVRPVL